MEVTLSDAQTWAIIGILGTLLIALCATTPLLIRAQTRTLRAELRHGLATLSAEFDRKLAEQSAEFDRKLAEQSARFDRRMAEFDRKLAEQGAAITALSAEVSALRQRVEDIAADLRPIKDHLIEASLSQLRVMS